jgi:curved DNA-binding protein CbpA
VTGKLQAVLHPGRRRTAEHHRGAGRTSRSDPFQVLGLAPQADLTDGQVHAAWRRIASATHPDRDDGGDPPRFALAAAAYTTLRTRSGRGEALADRQATPPAPARPSLPGRVTRGRPVRLALRTLIAAAASTGAVAAAGPHPAAPALVTGILTWLALTARHDLAAADPPAAAQDDRPHDARLGQPPDSK